MPMNAPRMIKRAKDSPEQHAMLVLVGDAEVPEDHHDDEDVVGGERQLDQIARHEKQSLLGSFPEIENGRENQRQRRPDGDPYARFFRLDGVGLAMKDSEVERQRSQHEDREPDIDPASSFPLRLYSSVGPAAKKTKGEPLRYTVVSRSGLAYEDHAPTEDSMNGSPVLTIGGIEPLAGFNRLLPTCLVESSTNQDGNSGSGDD